MRNRFIALTVGLALLNCGGPEYFDVASKHQSIVGGINTVMGEYPAVMALFAQLPNEDKGALCTATLVAPKWLIAAAHCVSPQTVGEGVTFKVLRGDDLTKKETAGPILDVAQVYWNQKFNSGAVSAGNDISLIELTQEITDTDPIPYMQDPLPANLKGKPIELVGYGLNDGFGQKGAGIKRKAEVPLNSFDNLFVKTGTNGKTICSGDSGGPVLATIDGVTKVIAVNSFGFIFCMGEASSTRVDTYQAWVQQYIP